MEDQGDHRGWFARNWKWAVPTGGCLVVIILAVLFFSSMFVGISSMFKESAPYQEAVAKAQQNERLIELIGQPIETTGMMSGNVSYDGDDGQAQFSIPIEGPNGKARIKVDAEKIDGTWIYHQMEAIIESGGEHIPLLEAEESNMEVKDGL